MIFPSIDYNYWLTNWTLTTGNLLTYQSVHSIRYIQTQSNLVDCAREVESITTINVELLDHENILRSLDLILAWGGITGRMFYFNRSKENCTVLAPRFQFRDQGSTEYNKYILAAKLAQQGDPQSVEMFSKIFGVGISFGSKFAYFWSKSSPGRLIILDAKIAGVFWFESPQDLLRVHPYIAIVKKFCDKAQVEFGVNDASLIEKALFAFHSQHFKNDNRGFNPARGSDMKDYDEGTRISKLLF